MDWEQEYKKLKRHCDDVLMPLLTSALRHVPENVDEEPDYSNSIAPLTADLPTIMTMATPHERRMVAHKVQQKIIDGKWVGSLSKLAPNRQMPVVALITQRQKELQAKGARSGRGQVLFKVVHVLLVSWGEYPTEQRNVCSHICHKNDCIERGHIIWSSSNDNNRRERKCRLQKKCNCGLVPPCNFELHK